MKLHEQQDAEAAFDAAALSENDDRPWKKRRGGNFGREWKCQVEGCDKEFKSEKALTTHFNITHLGRRDFQCSTCEQTFGYKHLLQRHVAKCHTTPSEPPSSGDEDEEIQPVVPPQLDIGAITGVTYTRGALEKLAATTALRCPHPDLHGLDPDLGIPTSTPCEYVFSRAYDLRRHLQATHNVVLDKEVVLRWVQRVKNAR
ncbi:Transcriptional factor IIIa [Mycena indigotica]|uniref:Transcriptional factor IIIa n=1 Tax=Mycena indigotica TaxID=2126181 RepID=A0A8H6TGA8_9AGAR|nr:Transcriptional factor IIIa [Mycena indigotica]KAF7315220.1 Transcriptional factor IIIa [Mycena indigotica]